MGRGPSGLRPRIIHDDSRGRSATRQISNGGRAVRWTLDLVANICTVDRVNSREGTQCHNLLKQIQFDTSRYFTYHV